MEVNATEKNPFIEGTFISVQVISRQQFFFATLYIYDYSINEYETLIIIINK